MLRGIDCVMIRVPDLAAAISFYAQAFGLRPLWRDDHAAGMGMPESNAEIVLHTMDVPAEYGVHYLVDDVDDAVVAYERAGCTVRLAPFDIAVGRCAVVGDPYGNAVCVLDLRNGPRAQ